jgi:putative ABC transport system permease protein
MQSLLIALIGTSIGAFASLLLTRLMKDLLYGIRPNDPATFIAVMVIVMCIALGATYIPTRRVTRLLPMAVLREE